jgi:hypothetical protein
VAADVDVLMIENETKMVQVDNQDPHRQVTFSIQLGEVARRRHWRDSYLLTISFSGSTATLATPPFRPTRETRLCAVMAVPSGGEVPHQWH